MIDYSTDPRFQTTEKEQKSIDEMKERNRQIWIDIENDKKRKLEQKKQDKAKGTKKNKNSTFS